MVESGADYEPVVLEAARDLLARLQARPGPGRNVRQLRTALARRVEAAARKLGVSEREVWRALRRALEEFGYEFPRAGKLERGRWTWQVARRLEAVGDRLVRRGLVVKRRDSDGQVWWAVNTSLPLAEALRVRATLDAEERAFLETLARLAGHRDLAV